MDMGAGDNRAAGRGEHACGADQIDVGCAAQVAGETDGRLDAQRACVGGGQLHLNGRAFGAEHGNACDFAFRGYNANPLLTQKLPRLGQRPFGGQMCARAKQRFDRRGGQVDMARGYLNRDIERQFFGMQALYDRLGNHFTQLLLIHGNPPCNIRRAPGRTAGILRCSAG